MVAVVIDPVPVDHGRRRRYRRLCRRLAADAVSGCCGQHQRCSHYLRSCPVAFVPTTSHTNLVHVCLVLHTPGASLATRTVITTSTSRGPLSLYAPPLPSSSELADLGQAATANIIAPVANDTSVVAATEAAADGGGDAATPLLATDSPAVGTSPDLADVAADAPALVRNTLDFG